jgi:hypothetical protein
MAAPDCKKLLKHLSDYLDGDLSRSLCDTIKRHAIRCPPCERFIASLRRTVHLCRETKPPRLSPAMKASLRRKILALTRQTEKKGQYRA